MPALKERIEEFNIGPGTQAAEGVFHFVEADQYMNGLSNWLRKNPNASPDDIWAAQGMLQDLIAAMSGQ